MGNQECKFSEKFNKKYEFIEFLNDSTLGPIKIYRKKEPFYDYLMIVEKLISEEEVQKFQAQLAVIEQSFKVQEESVFLRLFGHEVIKGGANECNKRCRIRLFVEYYNFSLKNLIEYRCQQGSKFTLDEIMYILRNIMKTYHFYRSIEAENISFQSASLFLTPEGELRFSPLEIFYDQHLDDVDCNGVNCKPIRFKKVFKFRDKIIIYEIKKIVGQLTQLCNPTLLEDRAIYNFKKHINSCTSIQQVEKLIHNPIAEKLQFNPKKSLFSEEETTKIFKSSQIGSNEEFSKLSHNSKISVKNTIKELRKEYHPSAHSPYYQ